MGDNFVKRDVHNTFRYFLPFDKSQKKKKKVENSFFFLIAYDYLNLIKFLHFAVDKILVFLLILAKVEVIWSGEFFIMFIYVNYTILMCFTEPRWGLQDQQWGQAGPLQQSVHKGHECCVQMDGVRDIVYTPKMCCW